MITLQLCFDGMGNNATESDYDDWCQYVADHISDTCGFDVNVEPLRWAEAGRTRVFGHANEAQREEVMDAHLDLWDRWCRASDLHADESPSYTTAYHGDYAATILAEGRVIITNQGAFATEGRWRDGTIEDAPGNLSEDVFAGLESALSTALAAREAE